MPSISNSTLSSPRAPRRIDEPVVAGPPTGVRIRTRLHLSEAEAAALTVVGTYLGCVYRRELAGRVRLGRADRASQAAWWAQRKRTVTAVSSSRWAGAITRAVHDQYELAMRSLAEYVADLRRAVAVLEQRCALNPAEEAGQARARGRRRCGYRNAGQRFAKTRRLAHLVDKLRAAEDALVAGRPKIVVGGKPLWRNRAGVRDAGVIERHWQRQWHAKRMFLTADGEAGKVGGNETIRIDEMGRLRIKIPAALVGEFGSHLQLSAPVGFAYRGQQWSARISARRPVRYDITHDPSSDRWYLDASWKHDASATPVPLDDLRRGSILGVDLHDEHLACCVLDRSGNPIGGPHTITVDTAGRRAAISRDGRMRTAITALLDLAEQRHCGAIAVENLNFTDSRRTAIGQTMVRGPRTRRFRRAVAGVPTARFSARLTAMASRRGVAVIGVDAAYTSEWGIQHWLKPLQQQTSEPVTGHHAAAAAIGRRGLGLTIRRRPAGPRNGQRTLAGTPPNRPDRHPDHVGRQGSSCAPIPTR